jgi:hypothetical protein
LSYRWRRSVARIRPLLALRTIPNIVASSYETLSDKLNACKEQRSIRATFARGHECIHPVRRMGRALTKPIIFLARSRWVSLRSTHPMRFSIVIAGLDPAIHAENRLAQPLRAASYAGCHHGPPGQARR